MASDPILDCFGSTKLFEMVDAKINAASGVTAGSYGPTADTTPAAGGEDQSHPLVQRGPDGSFPWTWEAGFYFMQQQDCTDRKFYVLLSRCFSFPQRNCKTNLFS